ncbi:MAG: glycosyltransferase [Solirubrobacteraceae bacterium]
MRVAVDARALDSGRGVARWVRGLLRALAEAHPGDEWLAVVPGHAPVAPVHPGVRLVRTRLPSRAIHGAGGLTGRPTVAALAGGADVTWIPAPAPVAPGAPYVLSVHDRSWELRPGDFTRYERAWHAVARPQALARGAAAVTAVSHAVAGELAAAWGVDAAVVSPGVDAPGAGTPRPGRYLLWVGALEPRKAPDVMASAWALARARGLDAELVVAGDGRSDALRGPGVVATGAVGDAELAALYAGALALVTPSRLEGFGLPALEAAAHGTPAVVSDLACFRETLGPAAVRVPAGDPEALAGALLTIAADPALRERLGAQARERVSAYTWARAAAALHPLLAEAARR